MSKFFAALFFYRSVGDEYCPIAHGFGATHIVGYRYHRIAASVVKHIENLYKFAQAFSFAER